MKTQKIAGVLFLAACILTTLACGTVGLTMTAPPILSTAAVPGVTQDLVTTPIVLPEEVTQEPLTTVPQPSEVVFDLSTANTVPPEDVLQEIRYYGGGGGPLAGFNMDFCQNEVQPILAFQLATITDMEILNHYYSPIAVTCGWQMDEQVAITITNPSGQVYTQNDVASPEYRFEDGSVAGYYVPLFDLPMEILQNDAENSSDLFRLHGVNQVLPGSYQVKFEGQSGIVQITIDVTIAPGGKAVYSSSGGIILFGFDPNETVRVIYYPDEMTPVWHEYQIGSNGQLWIRSFPGSGTAAIFSSQSGYQITLSSSTSVLKCGNSLPTRTQRGRWLYLAPFLEGEGLPLYAMPDTSSSVTSIFPYESPRGHYVLTISEPICGGNATWWKVQTLEDQVGWAMESDEHSYLLVDEFGPHLLAECQGEFVRGQAVRVTFTDGQPLNLRQDPDASASVLDKIPEGTRLLVKDGPACTSDSLTWWQVESGTGASGWVAQGDGSGSVYYLEGWR